MKRLLFPAFLLLTACQQPEGYFDGECSDGSDNDGDGVTDCDDPDCNGTSECDGESDADTDADGDSDTDADADSDADADADADSDADADADADSDADTDTGYFDPTYFSWGLDAGIVGGQFTTVDYKGHDYPPIFFVELYEDAYLDTGDDRYSCVLMWEAASAIGHSAADPWFDWQIQLLASYYTDCDLDPSVWGSDPYAAFEDWGWEMSVEQADDDLVDAFIDSVGSSKWSSEYEPYVFGVQTFWDGVEAYETQVSWGIAWTLESGAIGDELLTTQQISRRTDGYYRLMPFYIFGLGH
jgi:hypothetical protein